MLGIITLLFLVSSGALLVMATMEVSTVVIGLMVGLRAFNKETGRAMKYLLIFTVVFRVLMLLDLSFGVVDSLVYLGIVRVVGRSLLVFYSKLPIFMFHQWLPKAHVEVTARASAVLGGVMLKFGAPVVRGVLVRGWWMIFSFVATRLRLSLMSWSRDFKVWVAFSSITHMTLMFLCLFKYVSGAVVIYLGVHTILSSAMFWHFSKEYGIYRTRSFYHFNNYGDSWLTYIWLGLPLFVTFIVELHLFEKLFYLERFSRLMYFRVLRYFVAVALMLCHNSVSSDKSRGSEDTLGYWLSMVLVSWLVRVTWFIL